MFAPVRDLGLVVIWDDGDDLHAEPRAPYPHAREVLALRAHRAGAGALIGGFARTAEAARLIGTGWAAAITADRPTVRSCAPQVRAAGADAELARDGAARSARMPSLALRMLRAGLAHGPVLVQVPRGGYAPSLACVRCRKHARCTYCHGPLELSSGHAMPSCLWCGRPAGNWRCDGRLSDPQTLSERPCGGDRFRMLTVGVQRTAEELGRAFANVKVLSSAGDSVLAHVSDQPALVVATPGAEPVAAGGYAAALLLDGWSLLARRDLRAGEEALRRWLNAAALVRSGGEGGKVVVMAEPGLAPVQALVRWDPVWHARRELADRGELHYPPLARVAELTGTPAAVAEELRLLRLPETAEVLAAHHDRITWDAPIHSIEDIEALPFPPRMVNIKPSRIGGLPALCAAYDYCAERGIGAYGGGQFELGPGRGHIQYLASLFHPHTPNDVAPAGYNDPEPVAGLPVSPLPPTPSAVGFRWGT